MAYSCPHDLDGFMPHLTKVDIKFRQQLGSDLLTFLTDPENQITCQDIGQFVDSLIPWMQNSNYKVSRNGIEIMTQLIDRLGTDFRPYVPAVLPCVVDRLGDARDAVRDAAQLLLRKLVERDVVGAQALLDKLSPAFAHKNGKVREEVLRCLVTTLNEYGAQAISLSKLIPHVVKLVSDPTGPVRDSALSTIVEVYKHVGERLRLDIQRRNLVPAAKLPGLLARLDEVRTNGELLPTATTGTYSADVELASDEVDRITMAKPAIPIKRAGLASAVKKGPLKAMRIPSGAATSGAMDEDSFLRAFEDVPAIQIFTPREVGEHMKAIQEIISDQSKEWNKRVEALKKIRSLVVAGAVGYDDFYTSLRNMDLALQASVRDLRSQVVREAAITISYLSQCMGSKFDKTAELLLPHLINLIQNSVKIMATAGIVTIKFIIQYTPSPRLLPILIGFVTSSKSKEIRRACCECLDLLLNAWPTGALERHTGILQDALRKGIADADAEARVSSRKAFKGFRDHFPDLAEALLQSLDPGYRKALQGELSSSSSSGSLAQIAAGMRSAPATYHAPPVAPMPKQHFYAPRSVQGGQIGAAATTTAPGSATGSTENLSITAGCLQRTPSLPRNSQRQRSGIPILSSTTKKGFRSNSAIDLQAAQRARARAQYSVLARQKVAASNTASLPRPRKVEASAAMMQSPERLSRTKSRGSGVSHSQPTSRSNSPSSKYGPYSTLGYHRPHGHLQGDSSIDTPSPPIGRRRLSSGIPRSTQGSRDTSRETSPNRSMVGAGRVRRNIDNRPPMSPITKQPVMTQRILQQSREAESALADALIYDQLDSSLVYQGRVGSPRKGMRSLEHNSDDSETSSVCSERSYDSYRRPSESYSWSGSQQRLANKDLWEPCKDINEIIALCASTTWQERKDGLVSLRCYLSAGKSLTPGELKHVTEIFTRMFMDAHTKGLCVFLDTLNEIIRRYKTELADWLYVLLQRIFHKVGTDLLFSTHTKLLSTLDLVRTSFPIPAQLTCIFRYLGDPAQTPSVKTKTAVLNYLVSVCNGASARDGATALGGWAGGGGGGTQKAAVGKVITWASGGGVSGGTGTSELRNAARTSVVSLWNFNTPAMTLLLSELPKDQQDIASNIVYSHMRKSSTGSEPGSPVGACGSSPPSLGIKPLSPVLPQPRLLLGAGGDTQEDVYKSLRRTTAEIQNYSYEALGGKLDRDRDTTSQDSGISQMSADNNNHHMHNVAMIEERMEELSIRSNYVGVGNAPTASSGPRSLQYTTVNGGLSSLGAVDGINADGTNGYNNLDDLNDLNEDELVQKILVQCSVLDNPTPEAEKRKLLIQLAKIFERGEVEPVIQNFKKVLRILLDNLDVKDSETRVTVLQILTEMLKTPSMKVCWSNFVELLIVRVYTAYCDESRPVVKMAETTAAAMSAFPFNTVLNTLSPLVRTGAHLHIQGAIRMLTKMIEMNPQSVTDEHLQALMPGLISATDHEESSVRKAAIFCMVSLHAAVGEQRFTPYKECLSGSKLKLLKLYLGRSQQTSVPTSPRNIGSTGGGGGGGGGSGSGNSAASGGS